MQVLLRMWRKGNSDAPLVGIQVGTATLENSMMIPQKLKNRTTTWSSDFSPGYLPEEIHTHTHGNWKICKNFYIIALLFMLANIWTQLNCLSMQEYVKRMWYKHIHTHTHTHTHTEEYYSVINKESCCLWHGWTCYY